MTKRRMKSNARGHMMKRIGRMGMQRLTTLTLKGRIFRLQMCEAGRLSACSGEIDLQSLLSYE